MPHFGPDDHPGTADLRQQAQHFSDKGRIVFDIGAQLGDAAVQQLRLAHDVAANHAR
jgi:hypothetical protein